MPINQKPNQGNPKMNMNLNPTYSMTAQVIGASRYSMDGGIKGAKVQIVQESSQDNDNRLGKEILTANAPYDVFEKLEQFSDRMPCALELDVEMTLMAGGKAGLKIIDARWPIGNTEQQPKQAEPAKANEPNKK
jgi:hypothetical protein